MALGAGMVSLSSCTAWPVIRSTAEGSRIPFDPALFTEEITAILLRTETLDYDILVVKRKDSTYNCIYMECTHNKFRLTSNKAQIFCTSHGAEFDFEGNVTKGPAVQKLKTFRVISEAGKLFVHLV